MRIIYEEKYLNSAVHLQKDVFVLFVKKFIKNWENKFWLPKHVGGFWKNR